MRTNELPFYDDSINTTGCCPKFDPEGWDGQRLRFEDKPFLRATTRCFLHVPLDISAVFARVRRHIQAAGAYDPANCIVLSRDLSPWRAEHLFSISAPVRGEEAVRLTGTFLTRVFEGPHGAARRLLAEMRELGRENGAAGDEVYLFITTCPRCAQAYGRNHVVGVVRIG